MNLSTSIVDAAVEDVEEQGETLSCKKGCGVCCRQLVPISPVEARRICDLVNELSEPRGSEIVDRFADSRLRLEEDGLPQTLISRDQWQHDEVFNVGEEYFSRDIPCPFLEDESCSIHADRPITCREYLVTSPAEYCSCPTVDNLRTVRLPLKVWPALARFDMRSASAKSIPWVPLILALDWATENPDEATDQPGTELFRQFFEYLTDKEIPVVPSTLPGMQSVLPPTRSD
ncbi:MAG: YkgJ family cysteine cluster protein [Desulfobacterales bacterium]|nr:YkgJ family cysteine cluster protein [Desulfobacterales bacterium]